MIPDLLGYWPPMARLAGLPQRRVVVVRGQGALVWDDTGQEYLDATAGLWYANIGHGRAEIGEAVGAQMARLASYSNFGDTATAPTLELAGRIASLAPLREPLVFLTSGGSDAVDTAVKIARRLWTLRGRPDKGVVLARRGAYHGTHGFGTALSGIPANSEGYGTHAPGGFALTDAHDVAAVRQTVDAVGADRIAAIFVEPVIGAGGIIPPADGYLSGVRALCDEKSILLVADEVITGFGRLGSWFACQHYGIEPDMLLFAKGATSGYAPVGGVVAGRGVWQDFVDSEVAFRHGYTYSGHAACAVAGLRNLDILEREGLVGGVAERSESFAREMSRLAGHESVAEVRTAGFLAGIQLQSGPDFGTQVVAEAARRGVLTRLLANGSLQVSPSFVITDEQLSLLADRLAESLDSVVARGAGPTSA